MTRSILRLPRKREAIRAPLAVQLVKNPPATRETWVPSLGWEGPLEKGKAAHSVCWPGGTENKAVVARGEGGGAAG